MSGVDIFGFVLLCLFVVFLLIFVIGFAKITFDLLFR